LTATLTTKADLISVKSIALHHVRVPLVEPFRISSGAIAEKDAILVELKTGADIVGWGEASPMSGAFYSSDTPERAWVALSDTLIPAVLSAGKIDVRNFYDLLREHPGDSFRQGRN
jgi:O-succinylbenzoate synthase